MLVFDVSDFAKDASKAFEAALTDEVLVNGEGGRSYKILPVKPGGEKGKSPFEGIPCITADISTREIVEIMRENRAGA